MAQYTVTASVLNVRKGPSTDYAKVSMVYSGNIVEITEISNGWGKIGEDKWISMTYVSEVYRTVTSGRLAASYTPTKDLNNRPIYLMQTDKRWKGMMYSATNDPNQTIGGSGCGPSSASMIINEWIDPTYGPVECCAWAVKNGYRHATSGSYWSMMKGIAVAYGLKFSQVYSWTECANFMKANPGSLTVCIMKKGNWTSGGHFILLYDFDDTYVYINDPASTKAGRQKNTIALLKSECNCYFCFAKPGTISEAEKWADKSKVETITKTAMVVAASVGLNMRTEPTTSNGSGNIIACLSDGSLVYATKKCGDWYWVTPYDKPNLSGWCAASYLCDADIDNCTSNVAVVCKERIDHMVKIGFINSPAHWYEVAFDIDYLTNLIVKIDDEFENRNIKKDPCKKVNYNVTTAISKLVSEGIITTPDYWRSNYSKVKFLDSLLIKAATWLS